MRKCFQNLNIEKLKFLSLHGNVKIHVKHLGKNHHISKKASISRTQFVIKYSCVKST